MNQSIYFVINIQNIYFVENYTLFYIQITGFWGFGVLEPRQEPNLDDSYANWARMALSARRGANSCPEPETFVKIKGRLASGA